MPTEHYHLWWEYLKRSEKYKEFCDRFDRYCKNEQWPISSADWYLLPDELRGKIINEKLPSDLKESKFIGLLSTFGNVYEGSFEKWLNWNMKQLDLDEERFQPVQVIDETSTSITLKIDCKRRFSNSELLKKCGDLIRIKRKEKTSFKYELFMRAYNSPTQSSGVTFETLKRYLDVYDLHKEGKKIGEIIQMIGNDDQKENFDYPEYQRAFFRDIKNAKKIIQNAESGLFPGPLH